ncbi:MAG: SNF2 helicase associated domain-containing protein, partial [Oscillospiraceae bacterium]
MNIKNFRGDFNYTILQRGQLYLRNKKLKKTTCDDRGNYRFIVSGTEDYIVTASISPEGELSGLSCDCPYDGGYCKHLACALLYLDSIFDKSISDSSSAYAKMLITRYSEKAALSAQSGEKVRLVPELAVTYKGLGFTLKIGREKLYVVSNIEDLYHNFRIGAHKKYGKDLEFTHSLDVLDEQSAALLELAFGLYERSDHYYDSKRSFPLTGLDAVRFFEIVKDSGVIFDGSMFRVEFADPKLTLALTETDTGRYSLKFSGEVKVYNATQSAIVVDTGKKTFFVCGREFTNIAGMLLDALCKEELLISKKEIAAFYMSVIRPVSSVVDFSGLEQLGDITPPEFGARLYLDSDPNCPVFGNLKFIYGDKEFTPESSKTKNPFCDHYAEAVCENLVKKYFLSDDQWKYSFYIENDDDVFRLLTEGIPALSEKMEILATDRFSREMVLRPTVRPAVGVRPTGSMLELELTAEGYSPDELRELLAAYKQGKKFHKLKDGSFSALDSSFDELFEVAESLNISDKALMKEKIKVPAFRMLYLDSLSKTSADIRIERSAEFRKQVKSYREMLNYSEKITVPEQLENVMREYQVYGYRWLKTLSAYGLGGILADDMGLGKTLQAIALMLDEKHNGGGTSLVVCPASLVLNWESEIAKFAPELSVLTVLGTAAERTAAIAKANEYDVVITSYSLIARDFAEYQGHEFSYVFLDEAQYIKNSSTQTAKAVKSLNSRCRFALTGTPVENSFA